MTRVRHGQDKCWCFRMTIERRVVACLQTHRDCRRQFLRLCSLINVPLCSYSNIKTSESIFRVRVFHFQGQVTKPLTSISFTQDFFLVIKDNRNTIRQHLCSMCGGQLKPNNSPSISLEGSYVLSCFNMKAMLDKTAISDPKQDSCQQKCMHYRQVIFN